MLVTLLSVAHTVLLRENYFHSIGLADVTFERTSSLSGYTILLLSVFFLFLRKKSFVEYILIATCFYQSFHLLFLRHFYAHEGVLQSFTMTAGFIVCLIPFYFKLFLPKYSLMLSAFSSISVLSTGAHIPIGMLFLLLLAWIFFEYDKRVGVIMTLSSIAVTLSAHFHGFVNLFDDNKRREIWSIAYEYWVQNAPFFGFGQGVSYSMLPWLQLKHDRETELFFTFLHSDWGTILFELGFIGLSVYLFCFISLIMRLRGAERLSLITFGAFMVFNFPLHLAPTLLLGIYLVWCGGRDSNPKPLEPIHG